MAPRRHRPFRAVQFGDGRYTGDPNDPDTDGNGIPDGDEIGRPFTAAEPGGWTSDLPIQVCELMSDPSLADSDFDGLTDVEEVEGGTYPRQADSDRDGPSDYEETQEHSTDPLTVDTDGDDRTDLYEVQRMALGYDPLVVRNLLQLRGGGGDQPLVGQWLTSKQRRSPTVRWRPQTGVASPSSARWLGRRGGPAKGEERNG